MINSMTGYGSGEFSLNGVDCLVEVHSFNHRYLDIKLKIPGIFFSFGEKIRREMGKRFFRGTFDIYITIKREKELEIDESLVKGYLSTLRRLQDNLGLKGEITLDLLLGFKDVTTHKRDIFGEENWGKVRAGMEGALKGLAEMRRVEGMALKEDIEGRLGGLQGYLEDIERRCLSAQKERFERLKDRVKVLMGDKEIDDSRMLQEMAYMTDKSDITEEIVRFKVHIGQFKETLGGSDGPVGRKMDFLCQEMGREVNTIGSKTIDADISSSVIELKSEVERIRAQIQNIE